MSYHFDVTRAAQCTAYLLNKYPNFSHNYTCLLKMLYLADRQSIEDTGSPITGDAPFALDKGPILSTILDLIKEKTDEESYSIWSRYIETRGRELCVVLQPGDDKLSDYDAEVLDRIFSQYGQMSLGELIRETHKLPEWIESYIEGTSNRIHLRTLLQALGKETEYDELSQRRIEDAHFAKVFGV